AVGVTRGLFGALRDATALGFDEVALELRQAIVFGIVFVRARVRDPGREARVVERREAAMHGTQRFAGRTVFDARREQHGRTLVQLACPTVEDVAGGLRSGSATS